MRIAHVPANTLKHWLVNVLEKLVKEKYAGVLFTIPRAVCDHVYVGETENFEQRVKHPYDVKENNAAYNALAEHAESTGHVINLDSASITEKERKLSPRFYL